MKARTRFLKSIISSAKSETTQMPWMRGATRSAQLLHRRAPQNSAPAAERLKRA